MGKHSGKDRNMCWISNDEGHKETIDFKDEVEEWSYLDESARELFGGEVNHSFTAIIPTKRHKEPACLEAKKC